MSTENLTGDSGRACAVVEYRQLSEHLSRLDGAQFVSSFSDLHQALWAQHTQTR